MVNPKIRDAEVSDSRDVTGLLNQLGYPSSEHDVVERLADLSRSPTDHVLVALIAADVVGVASINIAPLFAEGGSLARITSLVVHREHRGIGVGKGLVEAAEHLAREAACTHLQISSGKRAARAEAHRLYRRLGYTDACDRHALYQKQLT